MGMYNEAHHTCGTNLQVLRPPRFVPRNQLTVVTWSTLAPKCVKKIAKYHSQISFKITGFLHSFVLRFGDPLASLPENAYVGGPA